MTDRLPSVIPSAPIQQNFDALNERLSALQALIVSGAGNPEGAVVADVGAIYLREDGGAGETLYVKESESGKDEGWVAK